MYIKTKYQKEKNMKRQNLTQMQNRKNPTQKHIPQLRIYQEREQTSEFESYFYYSKVCFDLYKIFEKIYICIYFIRFLFENKHYKPSIFNYSQREITPAK